MATKSHNTLHISIAPLWPPTAAPPVDIVFEDTEAVNIDVESQKVTVTNTKPQETDAELEEIVCVADSETMNKEIEDSEMKDASTEKDDYIKPTTDDCKLNIWSRFILIKGHCERKSNITTCVFAFVWLIKVVS